MDYDIYIKEYFDNLRTYLQCEDKYAKKVYEQFRHSTYRMNINNKTLDKTSKGFDYVRHTYDC